MGYYATAKKVIEMIPVFRGGYYLAPLMVLRDHGPMNGNQICIMMGGKAAPSVLYANLKRLAKWGYLEKVEFGRYKLTQKGIMVLEIADRLINNGWDKKQAKTKG